MPQTVSDTGFQIRVNGGKPVYPPECCCCGAAANATFRAQDQQARSARAANIPACAECVRHLEAGDDSYIFGAAGLMAAVSIAVVRWATRFGMLAATAVSIAALACIALWLVRKLKAMKPREGHAPPPAARFRFDGATVVLKFGREMYARYFAVLNEDKLAGWSEALSRPLPIEFELSDKVAIARDLIVIGSDPSCDLVLKGLPPHAFAIRWTPGGPKVERIDLIPELTGVPVRDGYLLDGDLVSAPPAAFTVRIPGLSDESDAMRKLKLMRRLEKASIIHPFKMHDDDLIADGMMVFQKSAGGDTVVPPAQPSLAPVPSPPPPCVCDVYAKRGHETTEFLREQDRKSFKAASNAGAWTSGYECIACGRRWIVEVEEPRSSFYLYKWREVHE